jgi:preprotein translocase subunit SecA
MDSLRNGIGLRAIGQKDPLVEYKREGFRMFKQLLGLLDAEVATTIFKLAIQQQEVPVECAGGDGAHAGGRAGQHQYRAGGRSAGAAGWLAS